MVHAGILAMRSNAEHMEQLERLEVTPIDVVAINLYPFKQTILKPDVTLEDAIENIDIGGPTMIRAAAKNWQDVAVIVDPADYAKVIEEYKADGAPSKETKFKLAGKVFEHTANYDSMINTYLRKQRGEDPFAECFTMTFEKVQDMRYGENPHQKAAFYTEIGAADNVLSAAKQLHGKELSYNNINDANGALDIIKEFGADMVRLWAGSADYHVDVRCSDNIFKQLSDTYLKIRNTARYILGNLDGFDPNAQAGGDTFYNADEEATMKWAKLGVLAVEMEAAALYMNAARSGNEALCICTISDSLVTGEACSAEQRQTSFTNMMEIALDIL